MPPRQFHQFGIKRSNPIAELGPDVQYNQFIHFATELISPGEFRFAIASESKVFAPASARTTRPNVLEVVCPPSSSNKGACRNDFPSPSRTADGSPRTQPFRGTLQTLTPSAERYSGFEEAGTLGDFRRIRIYLAI